MAEKKKILVVDDEQDILTYLSTLFEDHGYATARAQDGEEALRQVEAHSPDLITLDISMPGQDGGKVYEALRNDPELRSIRVCIITGKPELRRLIYERPVAPPEGYLDKPVEEDVLLRNVRRILGLPGEPN